MTKAFASLPAALSWTSSSPRLLPGFYLLFLGLVMTKAFACLLMA
jgi:hypothetical protein